MPSSAVAEDGVDLRLHGRPVYTVFDLLGEKEDDITYSVGWGLAQSESLAYALLGEVFDGDLGPRPPCMPHVTWRHSEEP